MQTMRRKTPILAVLLALLLCLSLPSVSADEPEAGRFSDTGGHWAEAVIAQAAERNIFTGYPDGSFCPDIPATRAQLVTALWRMAGSPESVQDTAFSDVPADAWYAGPVAWACALGCVSGYPDGSFRPDGALTREAAMKILFACSGGTSGQELVFTAIYNAGFADSAEISDWARPAMYWGYYNELIAAVGTDDPALAPKAVVTRAQLAQLLVNYSNSFDEKGGNAS